MLVAVLALLFICNDNIVTILYVGPQRTCCDLYDYVSSAVVFFFLFNKLID